MQYIGVLTEEQKQAGFFLRSDERFIYLCRNGPSFFNVKATFLYGIATIREIREKAQEAKNGLSGMD